MIERLIINSLVIFGIHAASKDGQIFGFVATFAMRKSISGFTWWFAKSLPLDIAEVKAVRYTTILTKPLFGCPPCMASVWGIPFVLIHPLSVWTLVYLFALSGLNYIIMKLISR
jgi:hypothetical protein